MALDASKVRVGVTGLVSVGATTATAPTGTASALTGFTDLGYVSEDGVTTTLPDGGDSTPIKAWQNGATVRTIRATSEDSPEISLTLIETKLETLQLYYGTTVSGQTSTEGAFTVNAGINRTPQAFDTTCGFTMGRKKCIRGFLVFQLAVVEAILMIR